MEVVDINTLDQLVRGSAATATFVGIPKDLLAGTDLAHADPGDIAFVKPIIARAAATVAFNEAWFVVGGILVVALVLVPFLCHSPRFLTHESEVEVEIEESERLVHDVQTAAW